MECHDVERQAQLSIDDELSGREKADLEQHLGQCRRCQNSVGATRWFHHQLRAKLSESSDVLQAPVGLEQRICRRIRTERPRRPLRYMVPAAVAAGLVGVLSFTPAQDASLDPEEAVLRHSRNMPPEVRARGSESEVQRFFQRNLRYEVEIPRLPLRSPHLRLVGGRLSNLANHEAAHLMYDHRGARISVFARPLSKGWSRPAHFNERNVDGLPLLVGRHRGYNVVALRRKNVLYSLVSDVDDVQLIELARTFSR